MPKFPKLRYVLLAFIGLCALGTSHARAGVLLSINEVGGGAFTPDFYFINGNGIGINFSYGGNITGSFTTSTTNRPGDPIQGVLATTVNIGSWNAAAGQILQVTSQPWNDVAGFSTVAGPLTAAQLAVITAAGPGPFTAPPGPPWFITSDANIPGASASLTMQARNVTTFTPTGAAPTVVTSNFDPANNNGERSVTLVAPTGTFPYTLSHQIQIQNTGAAQTFSSIGVAGRSVVTGVPEPSTFIGAAVVAMGGLAVVRLRARRRTRDDA